MTDEEYEDLMRRNPENRDMDGNLPQVRSAAIAAERLAAAKAAWKTSEFNPANDHRPGGLCQGYLGSLFGNYD